MMQPSRFPFLDEGEALRRLNIDRDTLLGLVRDGRLRAYSGFGKGNFFRIRDLDTLYTELYGEPSLSDQPVEATPGKGKPFDPGYKVHVRLQADLKWYDLSDDDLSAWVREMHEDGYPRQRTNITKVMTRLQRLLDLMDEAASGWRVLQPAAQTPAAAPAPSQPTAKPSKGRALPMMGAPTTPTPAIPTTPPPPTPTTPAASPTATRGRSLQMFGAPSAPSPAPAAPEPTPTPAAQRGRSLQMLGAPAAPTPTAPPPPAPSSNRGRPLQIVARPTTPPTPAPSAPDAPKPTTPSTPTRHGKPLPLAGSPPPRAPSHEGE